MGQDQGSSHVSKISREQYTKWEEKGLYIFWLPSCSPELNRIENEWERIKEDELAGRMFEDEYELAMAVIEAKANLAQLLIEATKSPMKLI